MRNFFKKKYLLSTLFLTTASIAVPLLSTSCSKTINIEKQNGYFLTLNNSFYDKEYVEINLNYFVDNKKVNIDHSKIEKIEWIGYFKDLDNKINSVIIDENEVDFMVKFVNNRTTMWAHKIDTSANYWFDVKIYFLDGHIIRTNEIKLNWDKQTEEYHPKFRRLKIRGEKYVILDLTETRRAELINLYSSTPSTSFNVFATYTDKKNNKKVEIPLKSLLDVLKPIKYNYDSPEVSEYHDFTITLICGAPTFNGYYTSFYFDFIPYGNISEEEIWEIN